MDTFSEPWRCTAIRRWWWQTSSRRCPSQWRETGCRFHHRQRIRARSAPRTRTDRHPTPAYPATDAHERGGKANESTVDGHRRATRLGLLDRKPHALSGGQRQRVALGRAIVRTKAALGFSTRDRASRHGSGGSLSRTSRSLPSGGCIAAFVEPSDARAGDRGGRRADDSQRARHRVDRRGQGVSRSCPACACAGRSRRRCSRAAHPEERTLALGFLSGCEPEWLPAAMHILREELPKI